ncbi:alpha/beta-hydrolase [Hypoxylon trugodes]|uniref:alpha/beta-hydrolase n=1 Tax=Hypoxylon trugodes TaxID=326681 RepID=UPI00219376BC|nr:alpha/beta-hydrolase [Hypoxylon trugodes]KAI1383622.1 alpha/beta-hydrolase [Hypoxylon trugodes]
MARSSVPWLLGLGALVFGILAVFLEPFRGFLIRNAEYYQIKLPLLGETGPAIVFDSTGNLTYLGTRSDGVEHFQNIFYAEDASGKNRFAPPVPIKHEKGSSIDATQSGAWCMQGTGDILPYTSRVTNISENCLSLRIARSQSAAPNAKLPVAVWLHGGGHALGSASDDLYDPSGLVRQAAEDGQPIIYVGINYRLGLFAFATSDALVKAKHTNVGLRDQRAALEWVRDNIEHFGGDPKRVTAIGQSVGASDIGLQLTAFGGKHDVPFQQAIMMSGAPGLNFNTKSSLVANNTAAVAEAVGCIKKGDSQSKETIQCLREVPAELLANVSVTASRTARPPFGEGFFFPTYDGDFLLDRPSQLLRAGKFTKGVPIIASWVSNEGAWYASPATSTDEEVLASFGLWLTGHSDATKAKLLELYPVEDFEGLVRPDYDGPISPQYYRAAQFTKDIWFTCPILDFTWQYVKNGGADVSQVRLYEHNTTRFTPALEVMGVPMWRVPHLSDIPYVLNNQHLGGGADNSAPQLELSKSISRDIVRYVNSGIPSKGDGPTTWPAAFAGLSKEELEKEFPSKISLQLLGGPYANTAVSVNRDDKETATTDAEQAVRWEKMFERCEFINSVKIFHNCDPAIGIDSYDDEFEFRAENSNPVWSPCFSGNDGHGDITKMDFAISATTKGKVASSLASDLSVDFGLIWEDC